MLEFSGISPSGDVEVAEDDLPSIGSSPSAAVTKNGNFTITSSAGLGSLAVAGTVLIDGGIVVSGAVAVTDYGEVRVLAYDSVTGLVSYSFKLVSPVNTPDADEFLHVLPMVAFDTNGAEYHANLPIRIIDDAPILVADVATMRQHQTISGLPTESISGNIFNSLDKFGADGLGSIEVDSGGVGSWGTLVIGPTGAYTYTLSEAGKAMLAGLPDNDPNTNVIEAFTYTVRDGDGDARSSTLTITLTGDDLVSVTGQTQQSVFEKNLPLGTDPSVAARTVTGEVTLHAPDGLKDVKAGPTASAVTLILDGVFQTPAPIVMGNGTITFTGYDSVAQKLTYTYTLTSAKTVNTTTSSGDNIFLGVTDQSGTVGGSTLVMNVFDDVIDAIDDVVPLAFNATGAFAGNVLTNDLGADRAFTVASAKLGSAAAFTNVPAGTTGINLIGSYGTLNIKADGSYTYTRNAVNPQNQTDLFQYTARDADGDTDVATLAFSFAATPPSPTAQWVYVPGTLGGTFTVQEAGLDVRPGKTAGTLEAISSPDGSHHGEMLYAGFTYSVGAGLTATVRIADVVVTGAGQIIDLPNSGRLTILSFGNGKGTFKYEILDNTLAAGSALTQNFALRVTDSLNRNATDTAQLSIVDDVPVMTSETRVAAPTSGFTVSGNLLDNDRAGADGLAKFEVSNNGVWTEVTSPTTVTTSQGTFTIQTNGNYTYTVGAGASVGTSHALAYRITDGDNDVGNASLTVNFQLNGNVPWAGTTVAAVDDDALPTAFPGGVITGGASASGFLPFTYGPDGKGVGGNIAFSTTSAQGGLILSWNAGTNTLTGSTAGQGNVFTVAVNQDSGAYTVTLLKGYPFGDTTLPLAFAVTDANGDTATGQLNVMFGDALPGPFTAEAVTIGSAAGASVVGDLNSHQNPGPDAPGSISFQNSLSFNSPANGVVVKDVTGKDVTFNGVQLRWYIGSDSSVVEARTPNGHVAFSVDLDLMKDTFRVDVHEIDVADVRLTSATNFGNADMRGMNVGAHDVVLTSKVGQPVGTGTNLGGTKPLNAIGDMLRLDFIKSVTPSGTSVSYGEYYEVTQLTQSVSATAFQTVSFTVRAIKVNGETQADAVFAGDPDDVALTPDADTSDGEYFYIQFLDSNGTVISPASVSGLSITAVDTDGDGQNDAWAISNLQTFPAIQFRIVSSTAFSAVEIEATKAGTSMRLDPPWISVTDEPGRGLQAGGGTGAFTINVPVYRTDIDSSGTAGGTFGEMHVTFDAPPPPPVVTTSLGIANFVEKAVVASTAVVIDAGIIVSDPDSGTLTSGRVIINNYQAGDVLGFVPNASTGNIVVGDLGDVLYLSSPGGAATVAQWQAALRAVTFLNTSDTPNTTARSISFVVSDGVWESAPASRTVSVTAVNDPPTGQDNTITILEDEVYHFKLADFPFTDPENNALLNLQVTTLTTSGTLWRDNDGTGPNPPGFQVNAGNQFTLGNLNSGFLVFVPGENAHGTGYATFTYRITDNGGTLNSGIAQDPVARTITINVVSVNDAPEGAEVTKTARPDQTFVFSVDDFGFSDPNDTQSPNALLAVKITTLPATGQLLLIPLGGDINDAVDVTAGQFIARADIEAGRLVYVAPSDATGTGYAQFTFQVQDDGGIANGGVDLDQTPRTFTFDAVNAAPVVTTSAGDTGFAENGSPVPVDPGLTLMDQDNDTLVSVRVAITSGFVSGEDVLAFASDPAFGDISGSFDGGTGVLTLTSASASTLAQWQTALRAVTYQNTSGELTPGPRMVSFLAHDGEDMSGVATKSVEVASVFGPSITFLENTVNATPQLLDVNVSFTDVTKVLDGGTLVVKGLVGEDRVSVRDQGAGPGQISFDEATGEISFEGIAIGTAAGGQGDTFTITFNGAATTAAVEAVMRNLTYANVSDDPTETRTLEVLITNAGGEAPDFTQITGPTSPLAGYHQFFSGGSGVGWANVGTYTTFGDLDGDGLIDMLVGGDHTLIYFFRNVGTTEHAQFVADWDINPFSGANGIGFGDGDFGPGVSFSEIIPTFVDINGDGRLDIVFGAWGNANLNYMENVGTATASAFELRTGAANPFAGLALANAAAPAFADLDGDGDLDLIVGGADGAIRYFENIGSTSAPVFAARTGSDNPFDGIDFGTYSNVTLADFDGDGDHDLVYAHQGASMGAAYTTLRWFQNTGDSTNPVFVELSGTANPLNGNVYFGFAPTAVDIDGDGNPDLVSGHSGVPYTTYLRNDGRSGQQIVVNVTPEDDDLEVSVDVADASFTEDDAPVPVAPGLFVTSPTGSLAAATISITAGYVPGEDTLSFDNNDATAFGDVVAVFDPVAGTLSFTSAGAASLAQWQAALRAATYLNASQNPDITTREISFTVSDAVDTSAPATRSVTVTSVNDAPVNTVPASASVNQTGTLFFGTGSGNPISVSDVDADPASDDLTTTLSVTNGVLTLATVAGLSAVTGNGTATVTLVGPANSINAAVDGLAYSPAAGFYGSDVLTVHTSDGGFNGSGGVLTDTDLVTIVVNAAPNGIELIGPELSVFEYTSGGVVDGAVIGQVFATDPDDVSGFVYALIDDAGGRFAIHASTGEVLVADRYLLDYEQSTSHQIIVQATDPDGQSIQRTFAVTVKNIDPEVVTGDERPNRFLGGAGADWLYGAGGDDVLVGGDGNDRLYGGPGADWLYGEEGDDILVGGDGNDRLYGGAGADWLYGELGDDILVGGAGNDGLYGGGGGDWLYGAEGDDVLFGGDGNDRLYGGADADRVYGAEGDDVLFGGDGSDRLYGGTGADRLFGEEGDDVLVGGDGNDRLYGDGGADWLYGDAGDDFLVGGAGNDRLYGGAGIDWLYGEEGDDVLVGGAGNDRLYGGAGADQLYGDEGDDLLFGAVDNDRLYGGAGADRLYGDEGDDLLFGGAGNDRLYGGAGIDWLYGEEGDDLLVGGDGNDRLYGGVGADRLYGEGGDDLLVGGEGNDRLYGGAAADRLYGEGGDDVLVGGEGNDRLYGGAGADWLYGEGGDDLLVGGDGNDRLYGGVGTDRLYGEDGDDVLFGGEGNDRLYGGAGADWLIGGPGADEFVYRTPEEGGDTIVDFNRLEGDRIVIHADTFGGGLTAGAGLDESRLVIGQAPVATADPGTGQFLYDTVSGSLYWDADGVAGQGPVHVASLAGAPTLSASDFNLV